MGHCPKGRNSTWKSPADVAWQSRMSSFFQPEVSPMFQKPHSSRGAGGSAEAGVAGDVTADNDATESEPEALSEQPQSSAPWNWLHWLDGELVPLLSCLQGLECRIARAPARAVHRLHCDWHREHLSGNSAFPCAPMQ
eukprot:706105-Rhodomonas_salina.2